MFFGVFFGFLFYTVSFLFISHLKTTATIPPPKDALIVVTADLPKKEKRHPSRHVHILSFVVHCLPLGRVILESANALTIYKVVKVSSFD